MLSATENGIRCIGLKHPPEIRTLTQAPICFLPIFKTKEIMDVETAAKPSSFKARVALEALKHKEVVSRFDLHPTMLHQWKRALLEGVSSGRLRLFHRSVWRETEQGGGRNRLPEALSRVEFRDGLRQLQTAA